MRFLNSDTERYFIEMQAEMLARNVFRCGMACFFASLIVVTSLASAELICVRADATWRLNLLAAAFCVCISLSAAAAAKMPCVLRCLAPQMRELVVVFLIFILAALQFVLDPWYGARLLQHEPNATGVDCGNGNFSDTRPVLVLSIFVLASHLALPIRWICLLPLEVALGCLYAGFAFLLGGPDGNQAWSTFLLIQGLIICAIIGRRTIEDHQRHTFCTIIKERNLRAQSEFQLEQQRPAGSRFEDNPYNSEVRSRPETTPSSVAFEMHDGAHCCASLNKIIDIGRREHWYIDCDEIRIRPQVLGEGSYAVVLAGEFHGTPVAVKATKTLTGFNDDHSSEERLVSLLNEVRVLRRLRHTNIALLYGASLNADHADIAIVLEKVVGKTLEEFILDSHQKKQLQPCDRLRAIVDVSRALRYLHSRRPPIVHGDLKASNIMAEQVLGLSGFYRVKLLDFGLARVLTRHAMPLGGTLSWVAPEVVLYRDQAPHVKADVFSFGRVAFFVLTGVMSLSDVAKKKLIECIKRGRLPALPWPPSLDPILERCQGNVEHCVEFQAAMRPKMEMVGSFFESTIQGGMSEVTSNCTDGCHSIGEVADGTLSEQEACAPQPPQKPCKSPSADRSGSRGCLKGRGGATAAQRRKFSSMPVLPGMLEGSDRGREGHLPSPLPAARGHQLPVVPCEAMAALPSPRPASGGSETGPALQIMRGEGVPVEPSGRRRTSPSTSPEGRDT